MKTRRRGEAAAAPKCAAGCDSEREVQKTVFASGWQHYKERHACKVSCQRLLGMCTASALRATWWVASFPCKTWQRSFFFFVPSSSLREPSATRQIEPPCATKDARLGRSWAFFMFPRAGASVACDGWREKERKAEGQKCFLNGVGRLLRSLFR